MKPLIVANWKMNPSSQKEAEDIFEGIKNGISGTSAEVVVCPPFVFLAELKGLTLGAQNVYSEEKGAFTGEISGAMLKDLGVEYVLIGHSERRKYFNETDESVNKKIKKALESGLKVIFCIGETAQERNEGKKEEVLERQLKQGLKNIELAGVRHPLTSGCLTPASNIKDVNIAYEPVWAISSGDPYKTKELPTTEKVKEISFFIRNLLAKIYNQETAEKIRIIYGGSANSENAQGYLKDAGMQGLLVGGASLSAEEFIKIIKSAE